MRRRASAENGLSRTIFNNHGGHAMKQDTSRQSVEQSEVGLSLEELIRRGARDLIQKAIEVEVQQLLAEYENVKMLGGQKAVVRNGYLPAREVLTAVGNVEVCVELSSKLVYV
jgi:hypothetical protein